MYLGPANKPFHKTECRCDRCCQWMVDEIERLEANRKKQHADIQDASEKNGRLLDETIQQAKEIERLQAGLQIIRRECGHLCINNVPSTSSLGLFISKLSGQRDGLMSSDPPPK